MWQYGSAESLAGYVPALGGAAGAGGRGAGGALEAVTAPHWGEPARVLFSRNGYRFGAVGEGGTVALWRSDCMDSVGGGWLGAGWLPAVTCSIAPGLMRVGGLLLVWGLAGARGCCCPAPRCCLTPRCCPAPRPQEGLGRAEWAHHCAYRGGADLAFLGDTGSQLVVAGQGERGGCISLWDTLLPPESACIHEVCGGGGR
jgi:hypothetical protein